MSPKMQKGQEKVEKARQMFYVARDAFNQSNSPADFRWMRAEDKAYQRAQDAVTRLQIKGE